MFHKVSELSTVEEEVALVGHVEVRIILSSIPAGSCKYDTFFSSFHPIYNRSNKVIIGHGNLTPSCLTRGPTGLQFTGENKPGILPDLIFVNN